VPLPARCSQALPLPARSLRATHVVAGLAVLPLLVAQAELAPALGLDTLLLLESLARGAGGDGGELVVAVRRGTAVSSGGVRRAASKRAR
jgi:hypothetical protein